MVSWTSFHFPNKLNFSLSVKRFWRNSPIRARPYLIVDLCVRIKMIKVLIFCNASCNFPNKLILLHLQLKVLKRLTTESHVIRNSLLSCEHWSYKFFDYNFISFHFSKNLFFSLSSWYFSKKLVTDSQVKPKCTISFYLKSYIFYCSLCFISPSK
jgi:hypothetical protein